MKQCPLYVLHLIYQQARIVISDNGSSILIFTILKGKVIPLQVRCGPESVGRGMTAALGGGERSAARPGRSLPPGKKRYPFYISLGLPLRRSGRAENLAPTGIRSPDPPACSSVAIPTELLGLLL